MAEVNEPLTRDEIMRVVNEAANLIIEEMGWGNDATREADAVNLLVNVFGAMLDNPATTVDDVMDANYQGDGESGAEMVRSWWGWGVPSSHFACCSARLCCGITNGEDRIRGVP